LAPAIDLEILGQGHAMLVSYSDLRDVS
jgi:hypothetical protein